MTKFIKVQGKGYLTPVPPKNSASERDKLIHTANKTKLLSNITSVMTMSTRIPMLLVQLTDEIQKLVCTLASVKSNNKNVDTLEDVSVKASVKKEVKAWLLQVTKLSNAAKVWAKTINNCNCDKELELSALASVCTTKKLNESSNECVDPCAPLVASDLEAVCNAEIIQAKIKLDNPTIKLIKLDNPQAKFKNFFQKLFPPKPTNTLGGGQLKLSSQTLARRKRTAARKRESTRKRESQRKLTAARKRESQRKLTAQEMRTATLTKQSQKHRSEFRPRSRSHRSDFRPRSRSHRSEFRPRSRSHRSDFRRRSRLHRSDFRRRSRLHRSDFRPRSRSHKSNFRSRSRSHRSNFRSR